MRTFIYKFKAIVAVILTVALVSCETEFVNPNAPTDAQVLNSKEGLFALSVGIRQLYSTSGVRFIVETPAITTREGGITTTFQNMIELEDGGTDLPNFNSNVEGMWATLLRVINMCDGVIENTPNIQLEPGSRAGLLAHARIFKAMSIGALAQNYEQVVTSPQEDNNATFVSRNQAFEEAISLLTQAIAELGTTLNDDFVNAVNPGNAIDLLNTARAYQARFNLFAGNYDAALASANTVDLSATSVFRYDVLNANPVWGRVIQNGLPNFKPRDNFGLPASFVFDPADGRIAFYTSEVAETNQNGLPIDDLQGFFTTDTESIPVYLPGEMSLIIAEANVRKAGQDLNAAVAALDVVLTKNNDPYGVNANLAAYSGPMTEADILNEIYKNRRAELFLTGVSLEDSRRFGRPAPSGTVMQYTEERNRNFYPYPLRERSNNPNTPSDPSL